MKNKRKKLQTTKQIVYVVLFVCLADLQLSYILAFLGRTEIAETLSCSIVATLLGTLLGYFCKAFFETKEEEKVKYLREKNNICEENEEDI